MCRDSVVTSIKNHPIHCNYTYRRNFSYPWRKVCKTKDVLMIFHKISLDEISLDPENNPDFYATNTKRHKLMYFLETYIEVISCERG